ncbi:MAG: Y-family DNA polymerase [Longimicrobiales bacterium]
MLKSRTPSQGPKRILLVDCDMFFVQVARLEDPEGAGKEEFLLVGGSSNRGVITSASYTARALGVRSAMPTARALKLCPQAVVVPVPRSACVERSQAVRRALETLSPVVQAASIDEFYLDLTGTGRMLKQEPLQATADRIRRTVLEETDISVSIGGGTQRVVAKMATRKAKPAGVWVVPAGGEAAFVAEFLLADLPGIGPAFVEQLKQRGLVSVRDAVAVERSWLESWFGQGRGTWLWERVRGIDASEVTAGDRRKSISSERTFFQDVDDDDELEARLLKLCSSVASQLRSKEFRARTVTVKIRDHDFKTRQASVTWPEGIETDRALYKVASGLLSQLRQKRRTAVRLLGVGLSTLVKQAAGRQLALFDGEEELETERDRTITRAMDRVHERFGRQSLTQGRIMGTRDGRVDG